MILLRESERRQSENSQNGKVVNVAKWHPLTLWWGDSYVCGVGEFSSAVTLSITHSHQLSSHTRTIRDSSPCKAKHSTHTSDVCDITHGSCNASHRMYAFCHCHLLFTCHSSSLHVYTVGHCCHCLLSQDLLCDTSHFPLHLCDLMSLSRHGNDTELKVCWLCAYDKQRKRYIVQLYFDLHIAYIWLCQVFDPVFLSLSLSFSHTL